MEDLVRHVRLLWFNAKNKELSNSDNWRELYSLGAIVMVQVRHDDSFDQSAIGIDEVWII